MGDFRIIKDDDPLYDFQFDRAIFKWIKIFHAAKHHPGLRDAVEQVIILYKLIGWSLDWGQPILIN